MNRENMLGRLRDESEPWEILVIGGGATGLGAAVDAAARGYRVALVEQHDFAKSTSSRATKLMHGGVRYLEQGNLTLVLDALRERGRALRNAPHLVHDLTFVIPTYRAWQAAYYGLGLRMYGLMAGRFGIAPSKNLGRRAALGQVPTLRREGLLGGVLYHDGQFDDARLALALAQTAVDHGAAVLNYIRVKSLLKRDGKVRGAVVRDAESGDEFTVRARVVINATGVFTDDVRHLDDPTSPRMVIPSQGAHIVVDRAFLPGDSALMVPKTDDGRVMFAIPWHDRVVIGTTDVEVQQAELEPRTKPEEIEFLLSHARKYLDPAPTRADIRSTFAGLRPLVKQGGGLRTSALSRDHVIEVSAAGLVTITGGKWTTYRKMGEDVVDRAVDAGGLEPRPCTTYEMLLHGAIETDDSSRLRVYGSQAIDIQRLEAGDPRLAQPLGDGVAITGAQVVWAAREEMARTLEDVLARRTRVLFLDARAALEMAPAASALLAVELGKDAAWQAEQVAAFADLASAYMIG